MIELLPSENERPVTSTAPSYVLVTPAKNEAAFIGGTIESVISQTIKPAKWVIVDDGSTDDTAKIVRSYLPDHPFIQLLTVLATGPRNFGSKAVAFKAGLQLVENTNYSFVGNLDADITLPATYYETVLAAFQQDPKLGIAGGAVFNDIGGKLITSDTTLDSVGGAVQLFRSECFRQVGGYLPLPYGGIDAAAEIMARMHGWAVKKVAGMRVHEHRRTGTAQAGILAARFNVGIRFHTLGYSTGFYIYRAIYRIVDPPFLIGSIVSLAGFVYSKLRGDPVRLPANAVRYLRSEQKAKIRRFIGKCDPMTDET